MISKVEGTDTEYDGTYLKFTIELVETVKDKGIDAFKLGKICRNRQDVS